MRTKGTLIISICMLIAIVVGTTMSSLAWFSIVNTSSDNIEILTNGYVALTYTVDPSYLTDSSTWDSFYGGGVNALRPATATQNAVRNSLVNTDVTTTSGNVAAVAQPATFKSTVKYFNHLNPSTERNLALRFSASAYAVLPDNSKVDLSLQEDLMLTTNVTVTGASVATHNNNTYTAASYSNLGTYPRDYFDLVIADDDSTLTVTTACYIRQVDELVSPALRNARDVFINLQIEVVDRITRCYFYNYDAYPEVYAYAWGYGRKTSADVPLIYGQESNLSLGVPMILDPSANSETAFVYRGLEIKYNNTRLAVSGVDNTYTVTGASLYSSSGNYYFNLNTGYYDVRVDTNAKTLAITSSAYQTTATQYLGENGTKMTPLVGQPGWYVVDVPDDAECIMYQGCAPYVTPRDYPSATISSNAFYYINSTSNSITDTSKRVYYYYTGYSSSVNAVIFNAATPASTTTLPMTNHGNGWFSVDVGSTGENRIKFVDANSVETPVTTLNPALGLPYYDGGTWYAAPPAHY